MRHGLWQLLSIMGIFVLSMIQTGQAELIFKDQLVHRFTANGAVIPAFAQLPPCAGDSSKWHNCVAYSFFHLSNRIRSAQVYKNGKPDGEYQCFFYNGALMLEKRFVSGIEQGMRIAYSVDGQVLERTPYVDGKKHGLALSYYSDTGNIRSEHNYKDNLVEGEGREYYANGQLRQVANYHNGELHGDFKAYYSTGQLYIHDYFVNGLQSGVYRKYNPQGQLIFMQHMKEGLRHGVSVFYLTNNKAHFSVVFDKGQIIYGKCGGDGSDGRDLTSDELKNFAADRGYPRCQPSLQKLKRHHAPAPFLATPEG